ncbi:hypothetical protein ACJTNH_13000 [Modestobacter lacusdianchii]
MTTAFRGLRPAQSMRWVNPGELELSRILARLDPNWTGSTRTAPEHES